MAGHWCLFVPRFDVVQIAQNVPRFDVLRTVASAIVLTLMYDALQGQRFSFNTALPLII